MPRSAATNLFPQVVSKIRSKGPAGEISRLNKWAINALDRMEKPESDPDRFLALLQEQRLQWLKERDEDSYQYAIRSEKTFDERWRRIQRYWINVVFECAYFASLSFLIFLPWIRGKRVPTQMLHLGAVPFLLVLPYYLGYCMWSNTEAGPTGGVLYAWISMFFEGAPIWTPVDKWLFELLPKPLELLTQDPKGIPSFGYGGIFNHEGTASIVVALLLWPAIYFIGCAIHRSELKKKAREPDSTGNPDKPLSGVE